MRTTSVLTFNLSGNVRHQGLSIAGVAVSVYDLLKPGLLVPKEEQLVETKLTGSRGEFSFGLKPGKYRVEAIPHENTRFLQFTAEEIDVYNNTICNVSLMMGSMLTVIPITKHREKVQNAEILALGIEPTSYRTSATADSDGNFTLTLPRGKFHLGFRVQSNEAPSRSEGPLFLAHSVTVFDVTGDETIELNLPKLVSAEGIVSDVFGNPVKGAKIQVSSSAVADKMLMSELGITANCVTDTLGIFRVLVEPGSYDISISPDDSGKLFGIKELGLEINQPFRKTFQLMEGYRLRGQVQYNDKPLEHCLVRILGDKKFEVQARTGMMGQFSVGVPGGNYRVMVSAHPKDAPTVTLDESDFSGLAPWSRTIVVGGDTHVAVKMQEGTPLYGKIADDEGQSRPGIKVSVFGSTKDAQSDSSTLPLSTTVTDGAGKYCFFLAPGAYLVTVQDDLAKAHSVTVKNEPVRLDVDWHGWCQLRFEILGEAGQKVPRCRVSYGPYGSVDQDYLGELEYDAETSLPRGNVITGDDGMCNATVPAGVYYLRFVPPGDGSFEFKLIKQLSISSDISRTIKLPLKSSTKQTH